MQAAIYEEERDRFWPMCMGADSHAKIVKKGLGDCPHPASQKEG